VTGLDHAAAVTAGVLLAITGLSWLGLRRRFRRQGWLPGSPADQSDRDRSNP